MNYENEEWRDIVIEKNGILYDYTGMYQVSNFGRVRSLDRVDSNGHKVKGKILKLKVNNKGYLYITLHKDGKSKHFTIHRLVATAFIPNPDNLPQVNHKNETKTDNIWTNLEWVTQKYNLNYGTCQEKRSEKLKGKKQPNITGDKHPMARKVICLETKQVFGCIRDAEDWCGKGGVGACCKGRAETAGGYHWQYYEDYKREQRMQSDINNSRLVA